MSKDFASRIAALREADKKATPGPLQNCTYLTGAVEPGNKCSGEYLVIFPRINDARCFVESRNLTPDLLAFVDEAVDVIRHLEKFNSELCQDVGVSAHYPSADKAREFLRKWFGEGEK